MRRVISLFSGAGGIDLGLEAAGFSTKVCIDNDEFACVTLKANRDWAVLNEDIHRVSGRRILRTSGLRRGRVEILAGGPPCQPFSKSGFWKTGTTLRMNDPRASTLKEYIRVLRETLPHVFLLENVPGFIYENRDEGLGFFSRQIKRINRECRTNYSLSWTLINAADYGVPQIRQRFILVGCKDGKTFQFPKPTHSDETEFLRPYLTAWDAIGDLENSADPEECRLSGRWASLLPSIPEGQNYLWHTEKGGGKPLFEWRSRYWNFLLKLAKNRPSWTLQASPGPATGPFHWKNRYLTEHEIKRLQTFPEDYSIVGDRKSIQRQLGNAVPPALAEILALEIRRQLFGDKIQKSASLVPGVRLPRARATSVRPPSRHILRSLDFDGF